MSGIRYRDGLSGGIPARRRLHAILLAAAAGTFGVWLAGFGLPGQPADFATMMAFGVAAIVTGLLTLAIEFRSLDLMFRLYRWMRRHWKGGGGEDHFAAAFVTAIGSLAVLSVFVILFVPPLGISVYFVMAMGMLMIAVLTHIIVRTVRFRLFPSAALTMLAGLWIGWVIGPV